MIVRDLNTRGVLILAPVMPLCLWLWLPSLCCSPARSRSWSRWAYCAQKCPSVHQRFPPRPRRIHNRSRLRSHTQTPAALWAPCRRTQTDSSRPSRPSPCPSGPALLWSVSTSCVCSETKPSPESKRLSQEALNSCTPLPLNLHTNWSSISRVKQFLFKEKKIPIFSFFPLLLKRKNSRHNSRQTAAQEHFTLPGESHWYKGAVQKQ